MASLERKQYATGSSGVLNFHDDGSFYSVKDGETASTGICQDITCTLSVRPVEINGQLVAQTVVFRFLPDSVQMLKFAVDSKGKSFPGSVVFIKTK